jgi:hypothetical protein
MRRAFGSALVVAVILTPAVNAAQGQDASTKVAGGGISVAGWQGKVDASEAGKGLSVNDAKLVKEGDALHITTGPQLVYWNPANKASGNYTVKATFKEPQYMNLNDHAHPYGIVIAGNDLGTDGQTYLYCAVYGGGNFIVRGFGPAPFRMNGGRGEVNEAVNKAAGKGSAVTQEIAMSVKGDKVECAVNGKVVATYDKTAVVGEGKLKSTDGTYGIRVGHNAEVLVTGLTVTKN